MKLIILMFLIFKVGMLTAGILPTGLIVSPTQPNWQTGNIIPPVAGENFFVWQPHHGCFTSNYTVEPETHIDIIQSNINVFIKSGLGGNHICGSPPPPGHTPKAEINGLNVGIYHLSIYSIPFADDFPPAIADYSTYFVADVEFEVLGAPAIIDSTTNSGLALLILLLFITGFYYRKQNFSQ